jgi:choline kinase
VKAIILAAGRGRRMNHLTSEKPKCLVDLHGKTLLDLQIEALRASGINEIGLVTGYKNELLQRYNLIEFHNADWETSNMVASLMMATKWLEKDVCIVTYSDIFYHSSAITSLVTAKAEIAVTFDVNWLKLWTLRFGNPLDDAEIFRMTPHKFLKQIGGRATTLDEIEGQYMGLLRFEPNGWLCFLRAYMDLSIDCRKRVDMTSMLNILLTIGSADVMAVPYEGVWGEIDRPDDLNLYKNNEHLYS